VRPINKNGLSGGDLLAQEAEVNCLPFSPFDQNNDFTSEMTKFSNDNIGLGPHSEISRSVKGAVPWFCWPKGTKVHIVTVSLAPHDAIGNFVFSFFELLRAYEIPCAIYAEDCPPQWRSFVGTVDQLLAAVQPTDVIFFNFSIFDPNLDSVAATAAKKILYYHNITPARFFRASDPSLAAQCDDGRNQLYKASSFDKLMANSQFSAEELRRVLLESGQAECREAHEERLRLIEQISVCPPIMDVGKWEGFPAEDIACPQEGAIILCVGRIAAHKRIEDVIVLFDEYSKLELECLLLVVGTIPGGGYGDYLATLLSENYGHLRERIHFLGAISDGQLKTVYERCSVFVTMSEHEGFCLPLIEAMYFQKPIFAYAQPAMKETLGETGRIFFEKDFPAIASEIHRLLHNPKELKQVVAGQSQRFCEIAREADGRRLWRALEEVLFVD
jgi:glycosyltransferase involved in cell wall biosynthesis